MAFLLFSAGHPEFVRINVSCLKSDCTLIGNRNQSDTVEIVNWLKDDIDLM